MRKTSRKDVFGGPVTSPLAALELSKSLCQNKEYAIIKTELRKNQKSVKRRDYEDKGVMQTKKDERREKILTEAYRIFVEKKIEPVSMGEIAEAAGIGRATLFRYYSSKLELVIAVCTREWKAYLDALDQVRPISSVGEIPGNRKIDFYTGQLY